MLFDFLKTMLRWPLIGAVALARTFYTCVIIFWGAVWAPTVAYQLVDDDEYIEWLCSLPVVRDIRPELENGEFLMWAFLSSLLVAVILWGFDCYTHKWIQYQRLPLLLTLSIFLSPSVAALGLLGGLVTLLAEPLCTYFVPMFAESYRRWWGSWFWWGGFSCCSTALVGGTIVSIWCFFAEGLVPVDDPAEQGKREWVRCKKCRGSGNVRGKPCGKCNGHGNYWK